MRSEEMIRIAYDILEQALCGTVPELKGKLTADAIEVLRDFRDSLAYVLKIPGHKRMKRRLDALKLFLASHGYEIVTADEKSVQVSEPDRIAQLREFNRKVERLHLIDHDVALAVKMGICTLDGAEFAIRENTARQCPNCGVTHQPQSPHWRAWCESWELCVAHCAEPVQVKAMAFLSKLGAWPDGDVAESELQGYLEATRT